MRGHRLLAAAVLALAAVAARAGDDARLRAVDPAELTYTYAVGRFASEYTPPAPGSYTLPPIATVTDHPLLDATLVLNDLRTLLLESARAAELH